MSISFNYLGYMAKCVGRWSPRGAPGAPFWMEKHPFIKGGPWSAGWLRIFVVSSDRWG